MAVNLINGNSTNIEEANNNIKVEVNFPVGYIYMSTNNTDPSTYFGGTWQRIAKGRTLVGVDEEDTDFDQPEETGGEKEHTLTVDEIPAHSHNLNTSNVSGSNTANDKIMSAKADSTYNYNSHAEKSVLNTGGGQPHNNLQPYFTVYMWKKVS